MKISERITALLTKHGIKPPVCGFFISEGWFPIVDEAFTKMIAAGWDKNLQQVKEKFGGLRIYTGKCTEEVNDAIREAETKAWKTCEDCGGEGTLREGSWWRTMCDPCEAAWRERKRRSRTPVDV